MAADKKSSDDLATEAAQVMNDPKASAREKRFAASIVSQADGPEAEEAVDIDPERLKEIQGRMADRTRKLSRGEIRGRARPTPTKK